MLGDIHIGHRPPPRVSYVSIYIGHPHSPSGGHGYNKDTPHPQGDYCMANHALNDWAEAAQQALYDRAQRLADIFREKHYQMREQPDRKLRGTTGIRVAKRAAGVTIAWTEIQFRGGKGKRFTTHKPIARGSGYAYTPGCFPRLKPWEKTLIIELEKEFKQLRYISDLLANGMSALRQYDHYMGKLETMRPIDEATKAISKAGMSIEQELINDYLGPLDDGAPRPAQWEATKESRRSKAVQQELIEDYLRPLGRR